MAPRGEVRAVRRRYREGTLVLETDFETADGAVRVVDCMPERTRAPDLVRVVEGRRGQVLMSLELILRCDYGSIEPWVQATEAGIWAIAGPTAFFPHRCPPRLGTRGHYGRFPGVRRTAARIHADLAPLARADPAVAGHPRGAPGHRGMVAPMGRALHVYGALADAVLRSLITLKALTYAPTGGIVAAATTSLPEQLRGVRTWDYRYRWLRDSTFTLLALFERGVPGGSVGVAAVAAGGGRQARRDQHHGRPGRRTPPPGAGAGVAARL